MRRLLQSLAPDEHVETGERPTWLVGSRYEVIRPLELVATESRSEVVKLSPQSVALVLALRMVEDDGQEVIMGYLAKTGRAGDDRWPCGWGALWHQGEGRPSLGRRALLAWTLGGCYQVKGKPVLRLGADMDSEPSCELAEPEEVVILDLALTVTTSTGEELPRLRGKVRTDRGVVGWLTIEVPGAPAFLHNINLHCKEAVLSHTLPFPVPVSLDFAAVKPGLRRATRRASPAAQPSTVTASPWDVGGVYRTLEKVRFDEGPQLRAGKLVKVEAIRPFASPTGVDQEQLRLHLKVESGTLAGQTGWISCSSDIATAALDVRNHLEFQQVTEAPAESEDGEVFTVRLQRHGAERAALGLQLRGLEVDAVLEEGALPRWNKANPSHVVRRGDRIVAVNGLGDSVESMMTELKEKEILYVRLLRSSQPSAKSSRRPSKADGDEPAEEQWKLQRPALAEPAALIVSKASKESTKIHSAEDAEPEWKLFHEGAQQEEAGHGHCICEAGQCRGPCKEHCNEDLLRWFSCQPRISRGFGREEPAPEPTNG